MPASLELSPEHYRIQRGSRQRLTSHLLIGVCVLALFVLIAGLINQRTRRLQLEIAPLRIQQHELSARDAQVPLLLSDLEQWQERSEYQSILLREPDWHGILADVANASGEGVKIDMLSVEHIVASDQEEKTQTPVLQLRITGQALDNSSVLEFFTKFSESPNVTGMGLEESRATNLSDTNSLIGFTMTGQAKRLRL